MINYNGVFYKIIKEPFENINSLYKRGWYIIKNFDNNNYIKLHSLSIINNNKDNYLITDT